MITITIPTFLLIILGIIVLFLLFGKLEEPPKKDYTYKEYTTLCKRSGCHNQTKPNSYNEGFCNRCADDAFFDM